MQQKNKKIANVFVQEERWYDVETKNKNKIRIKLQKEKVFLKEE